MITNNPNPEPLRLSRSRDPQSYQLAVTLGQNLPKQRNGLDCFYYWGDSLPVGKYAHPRDGYEFEFTGQDQKEIDATFKLMASRGVTVPIVKDHKETADSTLGYIVGSRPGKLLYQFLGADARDVGLRNQISVRIDKNFKDGLGNTYPRALRHVAATPVPVIPDQQGFIAASSGSADEPIVLLLAADSSPGDSLMTTQQLSAAKELMGDAGKDLTPENGFDRLIAHCKAMKPADPAQIQTLSAAVTEKETALTAARATIADRDAKIVELSRQPSTPDPEILADRADLKIGKIELCVDRGHMPAEIGRELIAKVKPAGKPSMFMLSRNSEIDSFPVDMIIGFFEGKKIGIKSGEKTGIQTLSRLDPDVPTDDKSANQSKGNPLLETAKVMAGTK